MTLVKLFFSALSTLGSFELLRLAGRDRIQTHFLPSLTTAVQVSVLFLAGLWNLLPEAAGILYLLGFFGLFLLVVREKSLDFLRKYADFGYAALLMILMGSALAVKGKMFLQYDNFSHWALVVREMLRFDRFPNFADTLIHFQEYPLGSAAYIYYFAHWVGTTEPLQMLAQAYAIAAAILPLFSRVTGRKPLCCAALLGFAWFVFDYNTAITDLLVDTLLPMVGMCALLFAVTHCKEGCGKFELFCAACYSIWLVQIKNSGIFFLLPIVLVIVPYAHRQKAWGACAPVLLAPLVSLVLWQKHCAYVFPAAASTTHAMTLSNYQATLQGKSAEEIFTICRSFLTFALTYRGLWLTVVFCGILGGLVFLLNRPMRKDFIRIALFSAGLYLVYQLGNLGMYLLSMPTMQALRLGGVERYTKTVLLAILYLNMLPMLRLISDTPVKSRALALTAGFLVTLFAFLYLNLGSLEAIFQGREDPAKRQWLESVRVEYGLPEGESYRVLLPAEAANDRGYTYVLTRYTFRSNSVQVLTEDDLGSLSAEDANFLLIYGTQSPSVSAWVRTHYPDQSDRPVVNLWMGK